MLLFRPSNHTGQLLVRSLFCGTALTPPTALAPTFHWLLSCRLCQWQWPHDFWPSSEYDCVKNQRRPTSSSVANRFEPLLPFVGSGVLPVTPTVTKPCRVSAPLASTPRIETSSVCMLATYTVRPSGDTVMPCGVMPPVNSKPRSVRIPDGDAGFWSMLNTSTLSECIWATNRKLPLTQSCSGPLPWMIFDAAS